MAVDAETSREPHRLEDLWFDDGNLVIQAQSTLYWVYRGFLSSRSTVFEDMLALPQPPDAELVGGCPLVRLPDPENEVTPFLKAIFLPEFFMPYPARTNFDDLSGCLRLSNKYEVDYLRKRSLVHLSSAFPMDLQQADRNYYDRTGAAWSYLAGCSASWPRPDELTFRIRAILLAREVGATWILPWAFYDLSVFISMQNASTLHNTEPLSSMQAIQAIQTTFLSGHQAQITATSVDIMGCLGRKVVGCQTREQCYRARLEALERAWSLFRVSPSLSLHIWDNYDWKSVADDLCDTCLIGLKDALENARKEFFSNLPSMYECSPWEELKRMRTAAIGANPFD
ncbi:BTB domain-containing protein [Favolaschia claudopus]|uniref:BTB domain-containing protein n=1 Tax=Favolaschia claudopus TaxID=2862362 RepID=A0AAW0CAY2_9AGAR